MAQSISQEAIGATGLPGATVASRHAGATTSGAPTSGTFAVGDFIVDQSGAMYVCTVAGTPGTWQLSGVPVNENIAGKNFIINGGMDIWQRGTTVSINGGFAYGADRWNVYSTYANVTMYRQTTSDLTNVPSIQYAGQVQRTVSSTFTTSIYLTQSIETANTIPLVGKTVTMSFYAKCGSSYNQSGTGPLSVQFVTGTGTDQNVINGFTGANAITNTTVTITSAWQKFTVAVNPALTATVPTSTTESAVLFGYNPTGTAGANDWFQITGVQLEIAPQATPFSRAGGSIGGELALCQRYFWTNNTTGDFFGQAWSTTSAFVVARLPATMRTTPSFTVTSLTNNINEPGIAGGFTPTGSWVGLNLSPYSAAIYNSNFSGLTSFYPVQWGSGYVQLSAEL